MHNSELKTHPTLINHVIKEYELKPIRIGSLKARHNVIKLDLTIPLLSFWCIDIDLSIQFISLTLYMT